MKKSMKRMRDLALAHELHKFYENHHVAVQDEPKEVEKKNKNVFVWLVVSGIVAAAAAIAYFKLRSKDDFYGDDFWDEDEDTLFDDEDECDLESEEEFEEALEEALMEELAKELSK